jgi:hypothetical protein
MAITTLASVKTILEIDGTDKDAIITALIPLVEEEYLLIRNKAFDVDDDGNTVYPTGSEMTAIRMIEFQLLGKPMNGTVGTVSSESLSRYSVSYASINRLYPNHILNGIKRFVGFV